MKRSKRLIRWVGVLLYAGTLLVPFASQAVTYAANEEGNASWINASQISYNGRTFTDDNNDQNHEFHATSNHDCDDMIREFNNGDPAKATTALFLHRTMVTVNTNNTTTKGSVTFCAAVIGSPANPTTPAALDQLNQAAGDTAQGVTVDLESGSINYHGHNVSGTNYRGNGFWNNGDAPGTMLLHLDSTIADPGNTTGTANAGALFSWKDASTIQSIGGVTYSLDTTNTAGNTFIQTNGQLSDNCKATLVFSVAPGGATGGTSAISDFSQAKLYARAHTDTNSYNNAIGSALYSSGSGSYDDALTDPHGNKITETSGTDYTTEGGCDVYAATVPVSNYSSAASLPAGSSGAATGDVDGNADSATDCGGGVFNWVMCPTLNLLSKLATTLNSLIDHEMTVDESAIFNTSSSSQAAYYKAWNVFRTLGTALIVIAALVMVASQSLGFELLDAYTIRKLMPNLIFAGIFMSLSWPLEYIAVKFFNVLGNDMVDLVYLPFSNLPNHAQTISALLSWTTLIGAGGAVALGYGGVLLPILGSGALALLIALLIIVIRRMALILLIITAPLAIASRILPGTQKLWNLWKENFVGLLVMFPLVELFIAGGKVFAIIGESGGTFEQIVGIVAAFIPFFLIPLAFRMATGLIANVTGFVNDKSKGGFDRMRNNRQQRMERAGRNTLAKRADLYNKLQGAGSGDKGNAATRFAARRAAQVVGGYNVPALMSAKQAAVAKELNDQIASGDDSEIRALTAYRDSTSKTGWRSLAGKEVDSAAVARAKQRWGKDKFAQQAALSYEMRKASTDEEIQGVADNYMNVAKGWGMNEGQATQAWIGGAFENQNSHLEFKNMRNQGGQMRMDSGGFEKFVSEVYEKRGSYNMSQMGANTFHQLTEAYNQAMNVQMTGRMANGAIATQAQLDTAGRTITQTRAVGETFMQRYGGGQGIANVDEHGTPIMQPNGQQPQQQRGNGQPAESYRSSAQGAGHVGEAVRNFATSVGVYQPLDRRTETHNSHARYQSDVDQIDASYAQHGDAGRYAAELTEAASRYIPEGDLAGHGGPRQG